MNIVKLEVFGEGHYSGATYDEVIYLFEEDYNKIKKFVPESIILFDLDGEYSEQEEDVYIEVILEKDLLTRNFEDKDENDGDSLLYCIEDELCKTGYNIHEMVKNANTYINKLDTIVPVTCYIKKSKKSELRKIVDELNREIN